MKIEHRYLTQFVAWMVLWYFLPIVALPLMLFFVVRHFKALKVHRRNQEVAEVMHRYDDRWAELEGFTEPEQEPEGWKR
jgi:hypothetical protein